MSRVTLVAARAALWSGLVGSAATVLVLAAAYLYLSPDLPSVEVLRDVRLQTPLRVYTRDGLLIGEFGEQRRTPIRFEEVPPQVTADLLAASAPDFYTLPGAGLSRQRRAP